jgi:hypothetical protein
MTADSSQGDELSRMVKQYEMRMAYLNQGLANYQKKYRELQTKVQASCRLAGLPLIEGEPDPSRLTDEILRLRRLYENHN